MLKKTFLLAWCILVSVVALSQRLTPAVITSAGDVNTTNGLYLEWSLGEPFIETISSKYQIFTQGFHQPTVDSKNHSRSLNIPQEEFTITIVPNPVQSVCRALIERKSNTKLYLELSDINGRPLQNKISNSKIEVVDFNLTHYPSGSYILSVRNAKGSLYKTYKIIKAL